SIRTCPLPGTGSGASSYRSTSEPPSSWMRIAFTGTIFHMTAAELEGLAQELGLDVVGAAPASAYDETERHIRERRARGLFADMRFTMAQPEVSCHHDKLLPGARTVVSAAHCYYAPEPGLRPGERRLARYTWYDGYADRRARRAGRRRLDEMSLLLDVGTGSDPGGVSRRARRAGLRLRHLPGRLSVEPRDREAARRRGGPRRGRTARASGGLVTRGGR